MPIYLVYLNGQPVHHVIDKDTRFGAATLMTDGETAEATWKLQDRTWESAYAGHTHNMQADPGQQITADA